jgi:hypothetical protein
VGFFILLITEEFPMNPLVKAAALLEAATAADAAELAGVERYHLRQLLRAWLNRTDQKPENPKSGVVADLNRGERSQ